MTDPKPPPFSLIFKQGEPGSDDDIFRAAANAMLNKPEEAKLWVASTLAKHPGVTIEGFLAGPDWTDSDRAHMRKVMRQAGFPLCAKPEDVVQFSEPCGCRSAWRAERYALPDA
jgi:hypothetical protein